LIASTGDVSHCLNAGGMGRINFESETMVAHALRGEGFDASEDGTGRGTPLVPVAIQERAVSENPDNGPQGAGFRQDGASYTLEARNKGQAVAFDLAQITSAANRTRAEAGLPASTLNAAGRMHVATPWAVRRLTPRECERLQAFPDDFTRIPYRGKPADLCPDGPRYKALGNSMAVNVMAWIGERIKLVESLT
jgi:DNA (cytosine-5)-methyltransferase 1